jgi:tetratricopeptide (TPR) repeat protein
MSTGNTKRHAYSLDTLGSINWVLGDYSAALLYACEAQRVASISANLFREAAALRVGASALYRLGDYERSISFCNQARHLLGLCGLSGGQLENGIMNIQAEVHKLKSEYVEARDIHSGLLHEAPKHEDSYHQGLALLNIAEIDVSIGASEHDVQRNIEAARKEFTTIGRIDVLTMCETILADLYLREGNVIAAESLLQKCMRFTRTEPQIISYCLERLGDVSRWNVPHCGSSWTTVYLLHSLKFKENLGIHKALQFLGDIFLSHNDEATAVSLYTVALEGFTEMDVHRSRAECMLRLGEISKGHNDLLKAVELWETARPLFERSSQAKQVENIDGKLASVGEGVLGQHRKNVAHLAEYTPSGIVEDLEDGLSDIEDLEVDLDKAQALNIVAN